MYNQKPLLGTLPNYAHPLTPDIGAWLFNEGSGNKIFDLSGNSNHGTFAAGAAAPTWGVGSLGHTLDFDGENDFVDAGTKASLNFGTDNFTIAGRFKSPSTSVLRCLISKYPDNVIWWLIYMFNDGTLSFQFDDANVKYQYNTSASYDDDKWHHFAITRGATYEIYIDGKDLGAGGTVNTQTLTNTGNLYIGRVTTAYYKGLLDNFLIYDQALSASEIWQLYTEPYCWLAQPMEAELMYAAPPVGAIINQFQRANLGADLYDGVLIT